ncbi:MAG TPA: LemA family protein [Dehalococcoidia bacterium]|nr:LemA family protein [Dehalococcoidia bacterium]
MAGVIIGIVVVAIVVVLGLMLLGIYNGLIRARVRTQEAWSGIDVQLKRRADLVPNLVETVRGYAEHERGTFEAVTNARAMLQNAQGPAEAAAANNQLTQTLRSLFAVAEAYPTLRASENFMALQSELSDIEEKIAYARQFYNTNVSGFNQRIQVVPNVFIANMMGLKAFEFFEAEEGAREAPQVSFQAPQPPQAPTQ